MAYVDSFLGLIHQSLVTTIISYQAKQKRALSGSHNSCGADEGSRTLLSSLGSWRSTDELHPHGRNCFFVCIDNITLFPIFLVFFIITFKEIVSHYSSSFTIIFLKIRCDKV
mgnify:CR=1 FL=1